MKTLIRITLFVVVFMFLVPNVYGQNWFEKRRYELVEIERPKEIKELLHYFPMLQLLDAEIDWTVQINWYELEDKRTGEKLEAWKRKDQRGETWWRFRKKVDGEYWFSDHPELSIYWRWKDYDKKEKEYLK